MAYGDANVELWIERYGDILVISPARQNLKELAEALRAMPKPSEIEPYASIETPDRHWLGVVD